MLPKKNRITRKDFPSYKAKGFNNKTIRVLDIKSLFFSVVFYKTDKAEAIKNHGSIVVSKKIAKTAIARNTLKRRFYDLLAPYFKDPLIQTTVVVYPKIDAQKAKFSVLKNEMEKVFQQVVYKKQ